MVGEGRRAPLGPGVHERERSTCCTPPGLTDLTTDLPPPTATCTGAEEEEPAVAAGGGALLAAGRAAAAGGGSDGGAPLLERTTGRARAGLSFRRWEKARRAESAAEAEALGGSST